MVDSVDQIGAAMIFVAVAVEISNWIKSWSEGPSRCGGHCDHTDDSDDSGDEDQAEARPEDAAAAEAREAKEGADATTLVSIRVVPLTTIADAIAI